MSASAETIDRARVAERTARDFLDAHRRRDVEGMVALCDERATFRYPGFEVWGKQRVVRGEGHVHTIGRVIWSGMCRSFPDLTNEVCSIAAGEDGTVAAEVRVSGTQSAPWGVIAGRGASFELPHLFVLEVGPEGLIDGVAAYSDNASLYRQLGHAEVD